LGLGLLATTAAVAAASTGGLPNIGTPSMKTQSVYKGYYDHHIDKYLITDVSSKSQAKAMHINYSAELKGLKGLPDQYLTWKKGVKPVLLGQDDQIKSLAKKGKLTMEDAHIVINAPILTVGKG
jgi:hypothetical protein